MRWSLRLKAAPARERRLSASRLPLQFPIRPTPRIAVVASGFSLERNAQEFSAADLAAVYAWSPDAIVAPLEVALTLADRQLQGLADLPDLRCLVVLTDFDGEALSEAHRELLWQAFGAPVFEQLRGPDGAVMARECEVHDGMHLDRWTAITPEIEAALVR